MRVYPVTTDSEVLGGSLLRLPMGKWLLSKLKQSNPTVFVQLLDSLIASVVSYNMENSLYQKRLKKISSSTTTSPSVRLPDIPIAHSRESPNTTRRSYSTSPHAAAVESRHLGLKSGKTYGYSDYLSTGKNADHTIRSSSFDPSKKTTGKKSTRVRSDSVGKNPARKSSSSSKSKESVWSGSGKDIIGHREHASGSRTTVGVTQEGRKGGNPSRYSPTGGGGEVSHPHVAVDKVQHGAGNSNGTLYNRDRYTSRYDTQSWITANNIGTNTNNSNSIKPARESYRAEGLHGYHSGIPGGGCIHSKTKDSDVSPSNGGPTYAMNPLSPPTVNGVVPSSPPGHFAAYSTTNTTYVSSRTGGLSVSTSTRTAVPDKYGPSPTTVEEVGLRGLSNLGNTCFMNCILQCLSHTPKMTDLFKGQLTFCQKSTMKGNLAKAYRDLLKEMWDKGSVPVSPTAFKSQIQKYARRFMGFEQQDCQEFLRFLLSGLHDDLNSPQPVKRQSTPKEFKNEDEQAVHSWNKYLSFESSPISDLFMGQLKSSLVCEKCRFRSVTFDPFWDLSLPMKRSGLDTAEVSGCLEEFTAKERLTGSEKAYCEKCDSLQNAEKTLTIQRLPRILVLHLKRFAGLRFRSKLDTPVSIPLELEMEPFLVNKSESSLYHLYGITNHSGNAFGGHYTASCKHVVNGTWYSFNDSRVNPHQPPSRPSSQPYVLFYSRAPPS